VQIFGKNQKDFQMRFWGSLKILGVVVTGVVNFPFFFLCKRLHVENIHLQTIKTSHALAKNQHVRSLNIVGVVQAIPFEMAFVKAVSVCCSVLQCAAVCCSVMLCPIWSDIFESCFKARISKLVGLFSLKRGKRDIRSLFASSVGKSFPKCHCKWDRL